MASFCGQCEPLVHCDTCQRVINALTDASDSAIESVRQVRRTRG